MFSHLDFLTLENGIDLLSQNVGTELPRNAVKYLTRSQISHDSVVTHALVWVCMVWFSASDVNLQQPHILKCKIEGKNLILHLSKYGNCHNHWDYDCLMAYEFPDWNSDIFNSRCFFWKIQAKQLCKKIKISNTLHNFLHESPYDRTNKKEMWGANKSERGGFLDKSTTSILNF